MNSPMAIWLPRQRDLDELGQALALLEGKGQQLGLGAQDVRPGKELAQDKRRVNVEGVVVVPALAVEAEHVGVEDAAQPRLQVLGCKEQRVTIFLQEALGFAPGLALLGRVAKVGTKPGYDDRGHERDDGDNERADIHRHTGQQQACVVFVVGGVN
ncbi:hypothetical protein G7054_g11991 [Neopestalotiopsis clavispora]|nr:hypothetical protein G7054_g11991 [Neopestalotiopsis clavispora]